MSASPIFPQSEYTFEFADPIPAGTAICRITATDPDNDPSELTYYLLDPPEWAAIDAQTGELSTTETLLPSADYYIAEIIAADPDGNEAYTVVSIGIFEIDIDASESFGVAWEGGPLDLHLLATTLEGTISSYAVDINRDGASDLNVDVTDPNDTLALLLETDLFPLLGAPVDHGDYQALLHVGTDGGLGAHFFMRVRVGDVPPAINVSGPEGVQPGEIYQLTVGTSDPGPDAVTQLAVSWGDGSSGAYAVDAGTFDHIYAATGTYTITVTATNEDGSWSADYIVEIGDTNAPAPTPIDPEIIYADATVLESGEAILTVYAEDQAGNEIAIYEWDVNGDGIYDEASGPTVSLWPDPDYGTYAAAVRITDAAGNTTEAQLVFGGSGPVTPGPTANTYGKKFREATPDLPTDWDVHHTKQQVLARRYLIQKRINVHDLQYLRGVPHSVHVEITNAQNTWWRMKARDLGISVQQAYWQVPWAEIDAFEAKLDQEYSRNWISAGTRQKTAVTRITNSLASARSRFAVDKPGRWSRLGFAVGGIALFDLLSNKAKAANNIANHTPEQLQKWEALMSQYDYALDSVVEYNRLKKNRAYHLKDAFVDYWTSLGIDQDTVNLVNIEMIKWIERNLHE